MVVKMFLSVIYYQVEDMHQLPTVGSHHGQPGVTGGPGQDITAALFFCIIFTDSCGW